MLRLDRPALIFSVNSFASAMLALYLAFALGFPQPSWAMSTAYIVSQPLSGAVRSKAVYRLLGTILGGAVSVVLVPALVNEPLLLSLALALWVGGCLAVSLLDRTPRSYLLMLAGYTACIIAFPSVSQPEQIFDTAVARIVEIGLGISCATLIHSLVFPRPVGDVLQRRLAAWVADADRWALDVLRSREESTVVADRRHLAAAASEIQILAIHLPFDTSRLRESTALVQTLHARMLLLIPLLSGIAERMTVLAGRKDRQAEAMVDALASWIEHGADADEGSLLTQRLETILRQRRGDDWAELLGESLLLRLSDLVTVLGDSHALIQHLENPHRALPSALQGAVAHTVHRPMHSDLTLALRSGAAATVSMLITCALWIGSGWHDGAMAAVLSGIVCCFFAAMDDPVPGIVSFGGAFLAALPLAFLCAFAVLPAVDGFAMLTLVLAPVLLVSGYFMAFPQYASRGVAFTLGFSIALGLQSSYNADFATFANANIGQFVGILVAIFVTGTMRSMGIDASVQRLQDQSWKHLSRLARAQVAPAPESFAAALVDRLGLLTPKLAMIDDGDGLATSTLKELRIGMNLVAVQELRSESSGPARERLDQLLQAMTRYFSSRHHGSSPMLGNAVLTGIDRALAALAGVPAGRAVRGITGLVGLRRNLFPQAPDYVPPQGEEVPP